MEQGPVLGARGFPLGPVAAIAGQTRLAVSVLGTQASLFSDRRKAARLHGGHGHSQVTNGIGA